MPRTVARSTCIDCEGPCEYWSSALGKGWVHIGPERGYVKKDHKPRPEPGYEYAEHPAPEEDPSGPVTL